MTGSNVSLDSSDGSAPVIMQMLNSMTQAFLNSPNFDFYESLRPPFGIVLFYLYASIVSICTGSYEFLNCSTFEYSNCIIQSGLLCGHR